MQVLVEKTMQVIWPPGASRLVMASWPLTSVFLQSVKVHKQHSTDSRAQSPKNIPMAQAYALIIEPSEARVWNQQWTNDAPKQILEFQY